MYPCSHAGLCRSTTMIAAAVIARSRRQQRYDNYQRQQQMSRRRRQTQMRQQQEERRRRRRRTLHSFERQMSGDRGEDRPYWLRLRGEMQRAIDESQGTGEDFEDASARLEDEMLRTLAILDAAVTAGEEGCENLESNFQSMLEVPGQSDLDALDHGHASWSIERMPAEGVDRNELIPVAQVVPMAKIVEPGALTQNERWLKVPEQSHQNRSSSICSIQ